MSTIKNPSALDAVFDADTMAARDEYRRERDIAMKSQDGEQVVAALSAATTIGRCADLLADSIATTMRGLYQREAERLRSHRALRAAQLADEQKAAS